MIQDIYPHRYDNAFGHRRPPREGDLVLLYRQNEVFLGTDEKGRIRLPRIESLQPEEQKELSFQFLIDETAFYSVEAEEEAERLAEYWTGRAGAELSTAWTGFSALRTAQPGYLAFAAITGAQLFRWRREHRFCGACGGRMKPSEKERALVCPDCGLTVYPVLSPAVIVAVTNQDRILLTKYAGRTYTRYALIAGFTEIGETIEETVHREVMEEAGLKVRNLRYYKSQPWSFSGTVLMGFFCELDGDDTIVLDKEELSVGVWMKREEMPDRSDDISLTSEMMEMFRRGLV